MKKKILFINGHLDTGGVEKSLLDILKHMDYERYDVDLLLTEHPGDYADQLPSQVNVILRSIEGTYGPLLKVLLGAVINWDWFSFKMRIIFLMKKLLGQKCVRLATRMLTNGNQYDVAVGFRSGFCSQIAAYAVNAKRRITWWHHGEINVDKTEYMEYASCCDYVISVSDACACLLAKAFPGLREKLKVIPNMMDVTTVCQKANAFNPYPEKDYPHIVSVGRLSEGKHFDNAIYAARRLKEKGITFQWHLVGDGVLRTELQQKAKDADVTDCFIFEGNQVNPYPYMKHADLFVHPSYMESFGIVVTEALALGVPCVVTKSAGVMDFLVDGENARLTEQNPEDLAEKVVEVLCNDELREHLNGNAHCPESFLPEAVMADIEDLLESKV